MANAAKVNELAVVGGAGAVAAVEAAGLDLASGKNINVTSILTANNTWSGLTATFTAGQIFALGDLVYLKNADSRVWDADADDPSTMPAIALATSVTTAGNPFKFLLLGFMRFDTWNWTPGSLLYASITAGTMSHTAPIASGDQVQTVGIAITADIILFNPNYVLVELT